MMELKRIYLIVKNNYDIALLLTGVNIMLRMQQEMFKRLKDCPKKIMSLEIDKAIEEYDSLRTLEVQLIGLMNVEQKEVKE